jgi:hypothetical protein
MKKYHTSLLGSVLRDTFVEPHAVEMHATERFQRTDQVANVWDLSKHNYRRKRPAGYPVWCFSLAAMQSKSTDHTLASHPCVVGVQAVIALPPDNVTWDRRWPEKPPHPFAAHTSIASMCDSGAGCHRSSS